MKNKFVAYYRVSTNQQGSSGLGLDAQRSTARAYAKQTDSEIVSEYVEIESGKKNSRTQLAVALQECLDCGGTLLIAKLDRLARKVHFISGLLDSNVKFVAADMPNADRFMLHVYAAMAEEEGRRIGERTKSALCAAKNRGVKLGEHAKTAEQRNAVRADRFAYKVGPIIESLRNLQGYSFSRIAEELNARNVGSYRGGTWHETTVYRVFKRYEGRPG